MWDGSSVLAPSSATVLDATFTSDYRGRCLCIYTAYRPTLSRRLLVMAAWFFIVIDQTFEMASHRAELPYLTRVNCISPYTFF